VLGEVSLVGKSTLQGNLAQRRIGLQHVLLGPFQSSLDQEGVRWLTKGSRERAWKVRLAALNNCTEIRNPQRLGNVSVDVVPNLARLPCQ
jgi:hypothetical protein